MKIDCIDCPPTVSNACLIGDVPVFTLTTFLDAGGSVDFLVLSLHLN